MKASTVTIPVKKNHMEIHWHDYADKENPVPIAKASLDAKASVIGRVGIMMLACGTGAWRVRSSMNELSELMNITCTVDTGLMSINYTCFDGDNSFTQSLCLTNTGVNTSQLNRLEKFVIHFQEKELLLSCDEIHSALDEIERIHSLYSPVALAVSAALAFIDAFIAGILASTLKGLSGYPRISITVPSIVIMVPGLYLYKGFYNLGVMNLTVAASWLASALLVILALRFGLIFARIITDKTFRYCT